MNSAWFRFYAELNDFLAPERRGAINELAFFSGTAVKDAIESFGVPHSEVDLVLANGEPVDFAYRLSPGDRISVYPVFEAFDIAGVSCVRPAPLRVTRFLADVHLGRLAAYLRMAGFDTQYDNTAGDRELAARSAAGHRILLTRDRELLKRTAVTHGYYVRATAPREQLAEVIGRFDLAGSLRPFERCLECNAPLAAATAAEAAGRVPEGVLERHREFRMCPGCGRVYWEGSHFLRMQRLLASLQSSERL
jgi:uncharacterized protein